MIQKPGKREDVGM